ncbi:MAG: hypothetical protein WC363_03220 [Candidatus Izemoplasmatales bacterium]|jgi:hypothetical protein
MAIYLHENLSLVDYCQDPCKTSSLPYWKIKSGIAINDLLILHDQEYRVGDFSSFSDQQYFRLYHDLKRLPIATIDKQFFSRVVNIKKDIDAIVNTINTSYEDIKVTALQVRKWTETVVYTPQLWLLIIDKNSSSTVGLGIADFDFETKEGILEWIQIVPSFRHRGLGRYLVASLLLEIKKFAEFATVSGQINNLYKPERLYRYSGFTGTDIWHVMKKID